MGAVSQAVRKTQNDDGSRQSSFTTTMASMEQDGGVALAFMSRSQQIVFSLMKTITTG
jgi:hypothetical protein